jgi:hypothetical protein
VRGVASHPVCYTSNDRRQATLQISKAGSVKGQKPLEASLSPHDAWIVIICKWPISYTLPFKACYRRILPSLFCSSAVDTSIEPLADIMRSSFPLWSLGTLCLTAFPVHGAIWTVSEASPALRHLWWARRKCLEGGLW